MANLRKLKQPARQASEMSDEELMAQPEKGAEEEGFIETVENFFSKGVKPEESNIAVQQVSPGSLEKSVSGFLSKLKMPQLQKLGEEIRLTGKAHVFDDSGKMVGTVGQHSLEGKKLKQLAREELERSNAAAPVFYKSSHLSIPPK